LSLALAVAAAWAGKSGVIDAQRYLKDVQYLASPELKGRGAGTPELEKPRIHRQTVSWRRSETVTGNRTYYQSFRSRSTQNLGRTTDWRTRMGERTELS